MPVFFFGKPNVLEHLWKFWFPRIHLVSLFLVAVNDSSTVIQLYMFDFLSRINSTFLIFLKKIKNVEVIQLYIFDFFKKNQKCRGDSTLHF